MKPIKKILRPL